MNIKKILKWLLIGASGALLTFSTIKSCKNGNFNGVNVYSDKKSMLKDKIALNGLKMAIKKSWEDITSWNDLKGVELTFKGTDTGTGSNNIQLYTNNDNYYLINVNGVNYTPVGGGSGSITFYYDNNLIRFVGRNATTGNIGSTTLHSGDVVVFNVNNTSPFSNIKSVLINSFDLPLPPTATLELDYTNLTNIDIDYLMLDNNIFPTSNIIDLTSLADGEHTITFYDTNNDNCFNSSINKVYQGFGTELLQPLTNIIYGNNSNYQGFIRFNWNSEQHTSNKQYKITLSGKCSYNFNYLTNKSYILNQTLDTSTQFAIWQKGDITSDTPWGVYSYNQNQYRELNTWWQSGNGYALFNNYNGNITLSATPLESTAVSGFLLYQNGLYNDNYGISPRVISFNKSFNNDLVGAFVQYSTYPSGYSDNMYSTINFIDWLLDNSTELTAEQVDTFQSGYNTGYQDGLKYSSSFSNLIYNFFDGIDKTLSIEILPNIQLKYIVYIPVVFAIIKFVMSWLR